ncbi:unnamed protein product [Ectocarpus sp. CCAP 1310/34]|nr:unnamed protein product [Ectocarpus sp. CCAP 1310/34]
MMPLGADGAVDDDECSVCSNLTDEQVAILASYDNGGKQVVCDPTCLDGVTDPLHCNYFGLGQICRGCGDCSSCEPCPGTTPAPETTSSPTMIPDLGFDLTTPSPVTPETPAPSVKAVKRTPSPETPATAPPTIAETPAPKATTPSPTMEPDLGFDLTTPSPVTPETPAPSAKPVKQTPSPETPETTPPTVAETTEPEVPTPSPTMMPLGADGAVDDDECSVCSNLTEAQMESLAAYPDGGKQVICDPRCVDGNSDITHCNYFGLGQICRGCGDCDDCTPCPVFPARTM